MTTTTVTRTRRIKTLGGVLAVVALSLGGVLMASPAYAAAYNVTTELELATAAATVVPTDEIVIQNDIALTATIVFPRGATIRGINDTVTISRAGVGNYPLFELNPTDFDAYTIKDLEFDGSTGTGSAITILKPVGQIVQQFTADNVDIHDFTATEGAAIFLEGVSAPLVVENSTFTDNTATAGNGGAIGGSLSQAGFTATDTTFTGNTASASGGAASLTHTAGAPILTLTRVTATDNHATAGGGGAFYVSDWLGTTITDSTFSENSSAQDGGAIWSDSLGLSIDIAATTFTDNSSGDNGGAVRIANGGSLDISNGTTFAGNHAHTSGGGIYLDGLGALDIADTTFDGNDAVYGGGVFIGSVGGSLTIEDTVFTHNFTSTSLGEGGGLWLSGDSPATVLRNVDFLDNYGWDGGGLFLQTTVNGMDISRSTFDSNSAGGDVLLAGYGGAIRAETLEDGAYLRIFNSTFSNQALQPGFGGGGLAIAVDEVSDGAGFILQDSTFFQPTGDSTLIWIVTNQDGGTVELEESTISSTTGFFISDNSGAASISHLILDTNLTGLNTGSVRVGGGNAVDAEWSIFNDSPLGWINDGNGNQFDTAALLGPLQDNGGRTFTMRPTATSPAIDQGDPNRATGSWDQRYTGFARILNGRIDIGAFETPAGLAATGSTVSWWVIAIAAGVVILGVLTLILSRRAQSKIGD